jgi:hypothetical protein
MAGFVVRLEGLDFAQIDETLGRVRTAIEAGQALSVDGLDPTALLGDLGTVIETVRALDTDPAAIGRLARDALGALGDLVELPDLGDLEAIVQGVGELVGLLAQVASVLSAGGGGTEILDRILTTVGGSASLSALVDDVTARAAGVLGTDLPDALTAPLRALQRLGTGGALDARELLDILGTVVVGVDVSALGSVTATAEAAVRTVASAGDQARLEAAIAVVRTRIDAAYAALTVGGTLELDVAAAVRAIGDIGVALDVVGRTELPRFVEGLATDLRTATNTLAELDLTASLDRLVADLPLPGEDIPRIMVDSLADLADLFDDMTGEALTAAMTAVQDRLGEFIAQGPLGDLLRGIDDAFAELGRQVDRLPLRALRDALIGALVDVQQEILAFDGFDFLEDLLAPIRELEASVREVDLGAVTGAIQEVVDTVNGLFDDFPIDDLRDAVDAVIDPLGEIVDELTPVVQEIATQLETLVGELEAVDFEAAGTATLDLLGDIRQQVQDAVDGGDVPDAVKAVIAGAAAILAELDLAAELTAPFDSAIVSIDVDALVAPIERVWGVAGDALRRATPAALIAELDPPFEQLLSSVDALSLEPLIGSLSDLFGDLVRTLEVADPRTLLAPLEQEFQRLLGTVRAALDPAPLFQPLRAAYGELRGLADQVDIEAVLKGVAGGLLTVPGGLTQAVGDRLQAGSGAATVAIGAADGVFRFGDVLRPMAAFVAEIRGRLDQLAAGVLGPALAELAAATRALRRITDPATGFATQVADALDARLRWLDPQTGDGPLAELRVSLEGLAAAVATVEVDAAARAELGGAVASVQLDARVQVDARVTAELEARAGGVRAASDGPSLGRSTRLLARSLDAALPPVLLGSDLDPTDDVSAFLDAVFARIDPSPLVEELDAIGERIQARLVALTDELTLGLYRVWNQLFIGIEPLLPGNVIARVQAAIDDLLGRLDALDPGPVEDEARDVVDAALSLLTLFSPARLAAELGEVFDAAIDRVRELDPATLLGDLDPFAGLKEQLEALRPSVVLAPLVERAASFTAALETITDIDLSFVGEVVARIQATFTSVLDGVEAEWNALLEELSSISGGVSVSVSVG